MFETRYWRSSGDWSSIFLWNSAIAISTQLLISWPKDLCCSVLFGGEDDVEKRCWVEAFRGCLLYTEVSISVQAAAR
jgi:hypothetical protein